MDPQQQQLPSKRRLRPLVYRGYAGLCEDLAGGDNLVVVRRFNELQIRTLLWLQDDIVRLEDELKDLDHQSLTKLPRMIAGRGNFRDDPIEERHALMKELHTALKEYNDYLTSYSRIRELSSAPMSQIVNLRNWFENNPESIDKDEREFIKHESDLIPLVARSKSWLRIWLEKLPPRVSSWIFPARHRQGRSKNVTYTSTRGMSAFLTVVIVFVGLVALLGPLWWLNRVHDGTTRLKIISGFVVVFSVILAASSAEQPMQVLVGTAAYAAVLAVFLQQNQ